MNDIALTTGHGDPIQKQFAFEDNEHIIGVICHDPRCLPEPGDAPQTPPELVQGLLGGELAQTNGNGATSLRCRPRRTPSP